MGFMQKQIEEDSYFIVETTDGSECVPSHVCGRTAATHVEALLEYLSGRPLDDDELIECQEGFVARLSAPGYLDCTCWCAYPDREDAEAALSDMFGEDDGEVEDD